MNNKKKFYTSLISLIVLNLLYALIFVSAKYTISLASPLTILMIRMLISGFIVMVWSWYTNASITINKNDWLLFIKTAFFLIYVTFVFEYFALLYLTPFLVTVGYTLLPLFSTAFEYYIEGAQYNVMKILGALIMLGAVGYILYYDQTYSSNNHALWSYSYTTYAAFVLLLIAIAGGSYAWFIFKKLQKRGYSNQVINGYSMILGGIMIAATWFLFDRSSMANLFSFNGFINMAFLIFVANIFMYYFYAYLIQGIALSTISFASFLCPSFIALYQYLTGTLTTPLYLSLTILVIIMSGLYIFLYHEQNDS